MGTREKKMRQETCQKILLQESIPHPIVSRSPGTLRLGIKSYGTGRSSDDDDDDDDCARIVSFQRWADMRNRRNPHRILWRFTQGVYPRLPTHQIPGSIIYNHGSHNFETRPGTGIAFTRPGGSLIQIFQTPENGGYQQSFTTAKHCFFPWHIHT